MEGRVLRRLLRHRVDLVVSAKRVEMVTVDGHVLEHGLGRGERTEDLGHDHIEALLGG